MVYVKQKLITVVGCTSGEADDFIQEFGLSKTEIALDLMLCGMSIDDAKAAVNIDIDNHLSNSFVRAIILQSYNQKQDQKLELIKDTLAKLEEWKNHTLS